MGREDEDEDEALGGVEVETHVCTLGVGVASEMSTSRTSSAKRWG